MAVAVGSTGKRVLRGKTLLSAGVDRKYTVTALPLVCTCSAKFRNYTTRNISHGKHTPEQ